ncbi:MAG: hypothetical protein WB973_16820 [Thermoanaerobaculia bacterium]
MKREICYVVGAGLTKSLEASRKFRVPLMPDFVAVLADHIESDVVLTALTNFEKGRVFDWSRPEWIAMADALAVTSTAAAREQYAEVLRRRPSENVEQLLRNALKKRKGNLYASIVEDRFSFAINTVFARIGWNLHLDPLKRYLRRQLALTNTTHTFVSYNYDLVLDSCLQEVAGARWAPETGYEIPFSETIHIEDALEHMKQFKPHGGGAYSLLDPRPAATAASDILVLKPHGSLNWLVPFEGNYKFTDDDPLLLLDGEGRIAYCAEFGVDQIRNTKRPAEIAFNAGLFVTPPLDVESAAQAPQFLVSIQAQSLAAMRDADEIVVIGWSMPSTDKGEVDRMSQAMSSAKPGRQVTAVNFNADVFYFQKLAAVCHVPETNVVACNAGFVTFVGDT